MPWLQRISITLFMITVLAGCGSLPDQVEHLDEPIMSLPTTSLSIMSQRHALEVPEQGLSAVVLQDTGYEALSQRLALVESAEQSIDIQYYIWHSDHSGSYLAKRLVAAADRGVSIRVMLDDINVDEREELLIALNRHPNIEIRIFNPIPTRSGFAKWLNVLGDFSRLNRRMHNKSFTVDGAVSVVGGRNIGDEYFDLSDDINFRDRDVMVMGPVVEEIQTSFVGYWNSEWSYPIELLGDNASAELILFEGILAPLYAHYPTLPEGRAEANQLLEQRMGEMDWVKAHYISDRPVPVDASNTEQPKETAIFLGKLMTQAQSEVLLESAYLVFDDLQLEEMEKLTSNGLEIKALTNSMASNDLVTNHSAYAGRRKEMLEHGIQLFELKPDSELCQVSTQDVEKCAPNTAYGLHTKSSVFDREIAGIGSFNFNLRSTYLNTESLLVIEDEAFAQRLAAEMDQSMNDSNSWYLNIVDGEVRWYSDSDSWSEEPDTGQWDRFQSWFLQLLPIEKYL
ncbi:phospholipase D family protein [Vibrio sp. FNV 38]|nr:phospholipase D family protein [Vibrio sp. FNV 38]